MRCLTLTQPYAHLVAIGAKRIETRSWATRYRGPLAIHAAAGYGKGGKRGLLALLETEPYWSVLRQAFYVPNVGYPSDAETIANELDYGAIVAVCELAYCIDQSAYWHEANTSLRQRWPLTDQERAFGDYSPGRYAWLLAGVRALPEPIPARGALGLWDIDLDTTE